LYVQDKHDFAGGEFVSAEEDLDACLWEQAQVLSIVEQKVNEESQSDQTQLEHDFKYKPRLERSDYVKSWRASLLAARLRYQDELAAGETGRIAVPPAWLAE
jgi:hypothetical protein